MADTFAVADRFLALAEEHSDTITPMQLLKLVYIAHGWMLGLYGRPLINDDVQAWQYGPVIPRLYNRVRKFRSNPVTERLDAMEALDEHESDIVDQVYRIYAKHSGPALSRMTHAAGTPWALTYRPGSFGLVISNDLIEDHYAQKARASA